MISFKSRNEAIRNADRITRMVNSVYPHYSESRSRISIGKFIQSENIDKKKGYQLSTLMHKNMLKIDTLRYRGGFGLDMFKNIIDMLKNNKIGNCYEESVLAQIIGKINGIKNIYPAKIYFSRNKSGADMQLDHVVSIITNKPFKQGGKYQFKNKDAIIIDPWFGITDFAENYFCKLRNDFSYKFPSIPDNEYMFHWIAQKSNSFEEFNQNKRKCFKPQFYLKLHDDEILKEPDAAILKKEYPELIIK